jgi:hypothetical protein
MCCQSGQARVASRLWGVIRNSISARIGNPARRPSRRGRDAAIRHLEQHPVQLAARSAPRVDSLVSDRNRYFPSPGPYPQA